jgi:hypothetical protein
MTPKEKAEELVDKYNKNNHLYYSITIEQAKVCALIAVDEMIAFAKYAFSYINVELATPSIVYLEKVKQEIEKL